MAKNGSDIKAWAEGVIDEIKKALGIGQGKSPIRDEVGKALSSQIGEGLIKNSKAVVDAFKSVKAELDYERKLELIDEDAYYTKLEDLRDRYFSKGTENWVKYSAEIYDYQRKLLENENKNLKEIYDTVSSYADSRLDEIRKKYEALYKDLSGYGGIYSRNTVYMNGKSDTFYSTRDIKQDIQDIKTYSARMTELKKILTEAGMGDFGISTFLDEVNSMGIGEGISFMNSLLSKGNDAVVSYADLWAEKVSISKSIGYGLVKDDIETATEDTVSSLKKALEDAGYEIPAGFFESGKASAENFGRAFLTELDEQLSQIRARILEFSGSLSIGQGTGNVYNSTTNQYNIASADAVDTVEQIRRHDTVKRLLGT